jgi:hypothetical protein
MRDSTKKNEIVYRVHCLNDEGYAKVAKDFETDEDAQEYIEKHKCIKDNYPIVFAESRE